MENQDTYNIYKLYKEGRDPFRPGMTSDERRLGRRATNFEPEDRYPGKFGKKVDFGYFGPEINDFIENLSEDEKYDLVEGYFKYPYRDDKEDLDVVLFNKLRELDAYGELDLDELQQGLGKYSKYSEDAEDVGGGSMRGYMEDELVSTFEGDGVMDLEEFIGLGEKYLSALYGGPRIDAGDMDLEEFVSRVGEEIGMDLRIRGNKVMLADYRN